MTRKENPSLLHRLLKSIRHIQTSSRMGNAMVIWFRRKYGGPTIEDV